MHSNSWMLLIRLSFVVAAGGCTHGNVGSIDTCATGNTCTLAGELKLIPGEPAGAAVLSSDSTCTRLALPDSFYVHPVRGHWHRKEVTVVGRAFTQPDMETDIGVLGWYAERDRRLATGVCDHGLGLYVDSLQSTSGQTWHSAVDMDEAENTSHGGATQPQLEPALSTPTGMTIPGIDSLQGTVDVLYTGMSTQALRAIDRPIREYIVNQEGDDYTVIDVTLRDGVTAECWIDDGKIERIRTASEGVRDEKGLGVGSTLAALQAAYPDGKLVIGIEGGPHANFVHQSRVAFEIDRTALPETCFTIEQLSCNTDRNARVIGITVHSGLTE